jgi:PAS domain S-box-containing protein
LDYDSKALKGKKFNQLLPPHLREKHDGIIKRYLESNRTKFIGEVRETHLISKKGFSVPGLISI